MEDLKKHPVVFAGTGKEYFGIWIVNLLLSIITLGIYSAWAKVRTQKYFKQHTSIADRLFNIFAAIAPALALIGLLGFFAAVPWFITRAIRFNARMTSWSGVRMNFDGTYWGSLGTSRFHFDSEIGPFLKAFGLALLWFLVSSAIATPLFFGNVAATFGQLDPEDPFAVLAVIIPMYIVLFIAVLPAAFIYQAYIRNAVYANTGLEGGHKFESTIKPLKLMWISVSNAVLTVVSLFLLLPWAQVRMMRYLADNTFVIEGGSLDDFVATELEHQSALGDAFADIEGIDIGIAI